MRRVPGSIALCCAALLLAGCGSGDGDAADTWAADPAPTMAPPAAAGTLSLSQVAGRWNMSSVPESGSDTTATTYVLTATADTTGWSITFPNSSEPVPVRVVSVAGDSIVTEAGPFASRRRQNMQVRTSNVWRMEGDRIVGMTVARYQTTGADSVLRLRTTGTRAP
jgi:hypothetical protein